jgi:hypothetical protein
VAFGETGLDAFGETAFAPFGESFLAARGDGAFDPFGDSGFILVLGFDSNLAGALTSAEGLAKICIESIDRRLKRNEIIRSIYLSDKPGKTTLPHRELYFRSSQRKSSDATWWIQ